MYTVATTTDSLELRCIVQTTVIQVRVLHLGNDILVECFRTIAPLANVSKRLTDVVLEHCEDGRHPRPQLRNHSRILFIDIRNCNRWICFFSSTAAVKSPLSIATCAVDCDRARQDCGRKPGLALELWPRATSL